MTIDDATEKVDFLIDRMEYNFNKFKNFDDFTFDVTNPADLAKVEYMVNNLDVPKAVKKAMKNEINKLKKSSPGQMDNSIS